MKSKLTFLPGRSEASMKLPVLCFIPGGPGLSSKTLRSMDLLTRSFDVVYIDPPGTGGLPPVKAPSFDAVVESMEREFAVIRRPLILCGHSFGAIYAIELAHRGKLNVAGLVALASPLSLRSCTKADEIFSEHMTPEILNEIEAYAANPTDINFSKSFASYAHLYFPTRTLAAGRELLLNDKSSSESCLSILPVLDKKSIGVDFVERAANITTNKIMIAGADEIIFTTDALRLDAEEGRFKLHTIKDSGHFVTFDQPEAVAGLIESEFRQQNRK